MTTDLVIFDCDGVLVDSEAIMQRVDLELVPQLLWHLTIEEIHEHFLGRESPQVLAAIERRIGRTFPD